ncbi:MAG: exodeoxyribonuclease VII small subunit [Clostridiales bacterium]|jgi:exodeoxyribonuclease VII small subunit|nr:exodeoxyribonuclease VII small subunit [Clostridiales bacterium]
MSKKKMDFEQTIYRLEEIVGLMERADTPLEKSVELYREGVELSLFCDKILNEAESAVAVLSKTADGVFLEKPFDLTEARADDF